MDNNNNNNNNNEDNEFGGNDDDFLKELSKNELKCKDLWEKMANKYKHAAQLQLCLKEYEYWWYSW